MTSIRCIAGRLVACVLALVVAVVAASAAFDACSYPAGKTEISFSHERSPDGRYTVIGEHRLTWLDAYTTLWIASSGESHREKWHLIGPKVDGPYVVEWTSTSDLLITNQGWPRGDYGPDGFQMERWRDVRIETRNPAEGKYLMSPDALHLLAIWTYRDSKGRRSAARLDTIRRNEHRGSVDVLEEGPWGLDAVWISKDRLKVRIDPNPGVVVGERPPLVWSGLEISFVSGPPSGQ